MVNKISSATAGATELSDPVVNTNSEGIDGEHFWSSWSPETKATVTGSVYVGIPAVIMLFVEPELIGIPALIGVGVGDVVSYGLLYKTQDLCTYESPPLMTQNGITFQPDVPPGSSPESATLASMGIFFGMLAMAVFFPLGVCIMAFSLTIFFNIETYCKY